MTCALRHRRSGPSNSGAVFAACLLAFSVTTPVLAEGDNKQHSGENHAGHKKSANVEVPAPDPAAAKVPNGYHVEVFRQGLTFPTSIEFGPEGAVYIAESGYSYGQEDAQPRILVLNSEGGSSFISESLVGPVNDLLWANDRLYISHRGKISAIQEGRLVDLVTGLPSDGDHHNNQMSVGPDGKIYFGQGTATNSGVVGVDNYEMGWLKDHPGFHDVTPAPVRLIGRTYESKNPLSDEPDQVRTSAFQPFGDVAEDQRIPGAVKPSGTVLRMDADGSNLEVYAWGLRNPYGVFWSPDGRLFASENGCDVRGSRPVANDWEDLYEIRQGAWYGWPDFCSGIPITDPRFAPPNGPAPKFVMAEHPPVEQPIMKFAPHSAVTKGEFCTDKRFGKDGFLFLAFFGHMAPVTGSLDKHGGHRVLAINLTTGVSESFLQSGHHGDNQDGGHGHDEHNHSSHRSGKHAGRASSDAAQAPARPNSGDAEHSDTSKQSDPNEPSDAKERSDASKHSESNKHGVSAGPRRLVDVRFGPDGALYVVDFGVLLVSEDKKIRSIPETGVIWRIASQHSRSP